MDEGSNCPATNLTLSECQNLCVSTIGCGAIVHNNTGEEMCYIKAERGTASADGAIVNATQGCHPTGSYAVEEINLALPAVEAGGLSAVANPLGLNQDVPGVDAILRVAFRATSPVPVGGEIHVIFMDGAAPTEVAASTLTFHNDNDRSGVVSFDSTNEIHVTLTDGGIAANETVQLTLDGLRTPQSERPLSDVLIATYHSTGVLIDGFLNVSLHAISAGMLVSTNPISFSTPNPGVTSELVVSYRSVFREEFRRRISKWAVVGWKRNMYAIN